MKAADLAGIIIGGGVVAVFAVVMVFALSADSLEQHSQYRENVCQYKGGRWLEVQGVNNDVCIINGRQVRIPGLPK